MTADQSDESDSAVVLKVNLNLPPKTVRMRNPGIVMLAS